MSEQTQAWSELVTELYEALSEQKADTTYHFEDRKVEVPSGTGPEAEQAIWKLDGKLRVHTKTIQLIQS